MKKFVMAFGTRPDQIKLAPLAKILNDKSDLFIWYSGQGWDIRPAEYQYIISHEETIDWGAGLGSAIPTIIARFSEYLKLCSPDMVIVHGDDATAYGACVAAFLAGVPVAHIEAGLRTYGANPYPEESFRRQMAVMASEHFCPSDIELENLRTERVGGRLHLVGNTVNDTLESVNVNYPPKLLVTLHRRENWGDPIKAALKILVNCSYSWDIRIIKHPNWKKHLGQVYESKQITWLNPVPRDEFLGLMAESDLILTDSGGLQEECALMGKKCLVFRESTERQLLYEQGSVTLVDPNEPTDLVDHLHIAWQSRFGYGIPGTVSPKIAKILLNLP